MVFGCEGCARIRRDEGRGSGVVAEVVGEDGGAAGVGVAVGAEVGAGVVHADVFAGNATAGAALSFVLEGFGDGRERRDVAEEVGLREFAGVEVVEQFGVVVPEAGDEFAVDAAVVGDAVGVKVDLLGAGGEGELPAFGVPMVAQFDQSFDEFLLLGEGWLGGGDVFFGEAGGVPEEVLLDLAVGEDVGKAEYEFVGAAPELVAEVPNAGEELAGRGAGGEDEGVESPDDALFADEGGELFEGRYALGEWGHVGFEAFLFVVVEGELEVVADAPAVEFGEVWKERGGVLAPEYDEFHAVEGDAHGLPVEGVVPDGVPFPQAVHEPFGIERRYVRGPAHGEDDGGLFVNLLGVFHDGDFNANLVK